MDCGESLRLAALFDDDVDCMLSSLDSGRDGPGPVGDKLPAGWLRVESVEARLRGSPLFLPIKPRSILREAMQAERELEPELVESVAEW